MQPWKTISKRTILNHSKWLTVEEHTIELPDGRIKSDWPWITTPEHVNVAAVTDAGEFLCFRQTKYGVEGVALAPVGGYIDPQEPALAAARRELLEETGFTAREWVHLGRYTVDGNHGAGMANLFLALGARKVADPVADDLEEQEFLLLQRSQVEAALAAGQFKVLSWATTMALALQHLKG
jgi:ADP-ribose pyrophosphatase